MGGVLARARLKRMGRALLPLNQALMGAAAVTLIVRLPGPPIGPLAAIGAAALGLGAYFLPVKIGTLGVVAVFAALAAWFL